jgi:protein TonB
VCKPMNEPSQAQMLVDGAYIAGIGGIGFPECVACPDPSYSEQARSAKVSGIVVLHLIVTVEGHAANIQVQRSLGYGLDEKAVKAVGNWRLKPAVCFEGKLVPVWTDIEVNFQIK